VENACDTNISINPHSITMQNVPLIFLQQASSLH